MVWEIILVCILVLWLVGNRLYARVWNLRHPSAPMLLCQNCRTYLRPDRSDTGAFYDAGICPECNTTIRREAA